MIVVSSNVPGLMTRDRLLFAARGDVGRFSVCHCPGASLVRKLSRGVLMRVYMDCNWKETKQNLKRRYAGEYCSGVTNS